MIIIIITIIIAIHDKEEGNSGVWCTSELLGMSAKLEQTKKKNKEKERKKKQVVVVFSD